MKCLDCKWVEINEHGFKGFLGESIITCFLCNKINSEMEDCEDFKTESIIDFMQNRKVVKQYGK